MNDNQIEKLKMEGDLFDTHNMSLKAGAASRQAEIDELQRLLSDSLSLEESESIRFKMQANELKAELKTLQEMHDATCLYAGGLFNERDELQKRIDEALGVIEDNHLNHIDALLLIVDILKGESNE